MKTFTRFLLLTVIALSLSASVAIAQHKGVIVKEGHPDKESVVRKRHGFFRRSVVYHPLWAPRHTYANRWVYFPRYNFYWDNFRNVYVIRNGVVWVTTSATPKEAENVDLAKEKVIELSKDYDSNDAIQEKNEEHRSIYKVN